MKVVTWNMGCAPRQAAKYRRRHSEAWLFLLEELQPDVCFVQEALRSSPTPSGFQVFWNENSPSDSGTAVLVSERLPAAPLSISCLGSYLAGAEVSIGGALKTFLSVHVAPPNYRRHLATLADCLSQQLLGHEFVVGGDFNAARHLDDVQGGHWFTNFFADLLGRGFHDCHWSLHGREVQSFWGHQARNEYQCDHFFVDQATAKNIRSCLVIATDPVKNLSDHGPVILELSAIPAVQLDAKKRLYKRLFSGYLDLEVAQCAAQQILSRNLHSATEVDDRILLLCLNICLTVSYFRPFTGNRSKENLPQSIPEGILRNLDACEMRLHEQIKAIRNRDHAHSYLDSDSIRMMVVPGPFAMPRWRNPFEPLSRQQVIELERMISKLLSAISREQRQIESFLEEGDTF